MKDSGLSAELKSQAGRIRPLAVDREQEHSIGIRKTNRQRSLAW
jgi:hypothetical protein